MSRPCCCDPWAPSEACPVHGDDEHRIVAEPAPEPPPDGWPEVPARAQEAAREPSCRSPYGCLAPGEGCPGRCPITDEEARQMEATHDPWQAQGPVPPPPF